MNSNRIIGLDVLERDVSADLGGRCRRDVQCGTRSGREQSHITGTGCQVVAAADSERQLNDPGEVRGPRLELDAVAGSDTVVQAVVQDADLLALDCCHDRCGGGCGYVERGGLVLNSH